MRYFGLFIFVVSVGGFGLSNASAAMLASAWYAHDNIRARLIAANIANIPNAANGKAALYAAIQFELQPGWHTYWRYPGASGMMPEFDFAQSSNVETAAVEFPAPFFFDDGVGGFYGYEQATGFLLPLHIPNPENPALLKANILIGVCREICVPVQFALQLPLPAQTAPAAPDNILQDGALHDIINALLAARPQPPSPALAAARLSFDGVRLQLVVTGKNLTQPQVMLVSGAHDVLGKPRIIAGDSDAFLFAIPAWSALDYPLIGRKMTLVLRDGNNAVEQQIEVTDHLLVRDEKKEK